MSDFFEPPPAPEPEPIAEQPPWIGPPENEVGVPLPLRILLARTEDVAVALLDVSAFSTGLQFRMEVRLRAHDELIDPFGMHLRHRRGGAAELPDELLRFGFELADGRRVTNVSHFPHFGEQQEGPVLIQRGGGGGGRSWSFGYWLWPLPPPGPITAVVEWPSQRIGVTRAVLDAGPILAAAAESKPFWPVGGTSPEGGWVGYGPVA